MTDLPVSRLRPCRQCGSETTYADGFCSDGCETEYNAQLAGEPGDDAPAHVPAKLTILLCHQADWNDCDAPLRRDIPEFLFQCSGWNEYPECRSRCPADRMELDFVSGCHQIIVTGDESLVLRALRLRVQGNIAADDLELWHWYASGDGSVNEWQLLKVDDLGRIEGAININLGWKNVINESRALLLDRREREQKAGPR